MTPLTATGLMVLVTLLWSMAGIVSRQIEGAQGLELTFWRSGFNALALWVILSVLRGPVGLIGSLRRGGVLLWASGLCWAVMFTAFMAALTLTTVANVLIIMALAPLMTAVLAWAVLGLSLPRRTALAIAGALLGVVVMQAPALFGWPEGEPGGSPGAEGPVGSTAGSALGLLVAAAVPLAAGVNWVLIRRSAGTDATPAVDLMPAVLIGALLSMTAAGFAAFPVQATPTDLAWLALLGVFQLAVPCLLAVRVARVLAPSDVALLSLLEVVFGVSWAWMGTGEEPTTPVVLGGLMVLLSLVINEWLGARRGR